MSCSRDGSAKLWDVSKQQCIHTYGLEQLGMGIINGCALNTTTALDLQESLLTTTGTTTCC